MTLLKKKTIQSASGFTLIELLIVIVIIGILAGVVIAVMNPAAQQRKANESVLRANTDKLCLAMHACAASRTDATTACQDGNLATFLSEIGANDPTGIPTGSTYTSTGNNTNPIVVTGTLNTCSFTCSYNTTSGATSQVTPNAGCTIQ